MNHLQPFWDAIKESSLESFGSLARLKSAFQVWLSQSVGRFGDYSTDNLRGWALHFTLSRREFADRMNTYLDHESDPRARQVHAEICERCGHLEWGNRLNDVRNGPGEGAPGKVCSKCVRNYYRACLVCNVFRELRLNSLTENMHDVREYGLVCNHCIAVHSDLIVRCESCLRYSHRSLHRIHAYDLIEEGLYRDNDRGEHWLCASCWTPESSRCQPRQPEFQFPALNLARENKLVAQDEIFEVATGGGDVSLTGLTEIKNLIANRTRGSSLAGLQIAELTTPEYNFDNRWMTREGNMPKRLAKLLLTTYNLKLTEELMSEVGNIAQRYTSKPGAYRLSITRNINQPRAEFVNGDSCWWTSYWWSRCNLKSLGGFGLRTWAEDGNGRTVPVGRAWMIPMAEASAEDRRRGSYPLKPAPETLPADAYIVFNGYGPNNSRLDSMEFARMIAAMTGKSYRKIGFSVSHNHMYVNGSGNAGTDNTGHGILVASQMVCDLNPSFTLRAIPDRCSCPGKPA